MSLNEYGEYNYEVGKSYFNHLSEYAEFLFYPDSEPGTFTLKHWTGSAWSTASGVKTWTGSAWVDVSDVKTWSGTAWI